MKLGKFQRALFIGSVGVAMFASSAGAVAMGDDTQRKLSRTAPDAAISEGHIGTRTHVMHVNGRRGSTEFHGDDVAIGLALTRPDRVQSRFDDAAGSTAGLALTTAGGFPNRKDVTEVIGRSAPPAASAVSSSAMAPAADDTRG